MKKILSIVLVLLSLFFLFGSSLAEDSLQTPLVGNEDTAFEYVAKFCSNYNIVAYESGLSVFEGGSYLDAFDFYWTEENNPSYNYYSFVDDVSLTICFDENYCAQSYKRVLMETNLEKTKTFATLLFKAANWSLEHPEVIASDLLSPEHINDNSYFVAENGWKYSIRNKANIIFVEAEKTNVPSYIIQFDETFLSTAPTPTPRKTITPKPTSVPTATPKPTDPWPSLDASSVKYNYANSVGKDFYLKGYAELDDYYNWAYDDYEKDFFCMRVKPAGKYSSDAWYIYFRRTSFQKLYDDALKYGGVTVELTCNITAYEKGQNNMAQALRVSWWH